MTPTEFLLNRLKDPLAAFTKDSKIVKDLVIKQVLFKFFREIEPIVKAQVLITSGAELATKHNPNSLHYIGRAVDFVLIRLPKWKELGRDNVQDTIFLEQLMDPIAAKYGLWLLNEYVRATPTTSGGHFHIEYRRS